MKKKTPPRDPKTGQFKKSKAGKKTSKGKKGKKK